jgi:hypothetical protein
MLILTRYRNALLTIIQESGLDPKLFTAEASTISKEEFFIIQLSYNSAIHQYSMQFDPISDLLAPLKVSALNLQQASHQEVQLLAFKLNTYLTPSKTGSMML